jgi:hypothetical protein
MATINLHSAKGVRDPQDGFLPLPLPLPSRTHTRHSSPRRVVLRENHRLRDPLERPVLMAMLDDLKSGMRPFEVMEKHGLRAQLVSSPDFVLKDSSPMRSLAWRNLTGDVLNNRFAGEERVGVEVVIKGYLMKVVKDKETGEMTQVGLAKNDLCIVKGQERVETQRNENTRGTHNSLSTGGTTTSHTHVTTAGSHASPVTRGAP